MVLVAYVSVGGSRGGLNLGRCSEGLATQMPPWKAPSSLVQALPWPTVTHMFTLCPSTCGQNGERRGKPNERALLL